MYLNVILIITEEHFCFWFSRKMPSALIRSRYYIESKNFCLLIIWMITDWTQQPHDVVLTLIQRCLAVNNVVSSLKQRHVLAGIDYNYFLSGKYCFKRDISAAHSCHFLLRYTKYPLQKKYSPRRKRRQTAAKNNIRYILHINYIILWKQHFPLCPMTREGSLET